MFKSIKLIIYGNDLYYREIFIDDALHGAHDWFDDILTIYNFLLRKLSLFEDPENTQQKFGIFLG